jgi:hypothetical protein
MNVPHPPPAYRPRSEITGRICIVSRHVQMIAAPAP